MSNKVYNESTPGLNGTYKVRWLGEGKGFNVIDPQTSAVIKHYIDIKQALNHCIKLNLGLV